MMKVKNLPKNWRDYAALVVTELDGEYWHWGCYSSMATASSIAIGLNKVSGTLRIAIPTTEVEEA